MPFPERPQLEVTATERLRQSGPMALDLEELTDRETRELHGFNERLLDLLPGLSEHVCGLGKPGGFLQRLEEGTYFGHVIEHIALELSNPAGVPVLVGAKPIFFTGGDQLRITGIDEDTAVVAEGQRFRVMGAGAVYVVDGMRESYTNVSEEKPGEIMSVFDLRLHILSRNDQFDLETRRPVSAKRHSN